MTPEQILAELSSAAGRVPAAALAAALEQREALTEPLLEALRDFVELTSDPEATYNGADNALADTAMYLLAQFRETRAFPLFEQLCRLPEECSEYWLGDMLTQDFDSFLASTCGGDPVLLQRLAADVSMRDYARWAALDAMLTLVVNGDWSRSALIAWMQEIWPRWQSSDPATDLTALVSVVYDLGASELLPQVREAYAAEQTDPRYEVLETIERHCALSNPMSDPGLRRRHHYVDDPGKQMGWQSRFHDEPESDDLEGEDQFEEGDYEISEPYVRATPKVGRNDPCPCGSGRKYKKCCMRAEEGEPALVARLREQESAVSSSDFVKTAVD